MATPLSKLDHFKLETRYGKDYVENDTYEWKYSSKWATGVKRWKRVKMIGSGGFASVWLEKEASGHELRAVKVIQRHLIVNTGFTQELATLVTLSDHSHLFVQFLGWYDSDSEIFIAMEFIRNGDLSGYMADQAKARLNAAEITKQILEGLEVLHEEGICHRDLKPQNILIACNDPIWVKIADFGASKRSTHTALRTRCGTEGYIAPEILGLLSQRMSNGTKFSFALDIWSLGCMIHELLTSQGIFRTANDDCDSSYFMTGLDTDIDLDEPGLDMQLLLDYCRGSAIFPIDHLQTSQAPSDAINLVQRMLAADPRERITASSALQSPWLTNIEYKTSWFKRLEAEFMELGIDLDLGTRQEKALMRQIRTIDIVRFLPTTANNLGSLLEEAISKGLSNAAWMLLKSPGRIVRDPLGVQRLFQKAVEEGRLDWLKCLLEVGKVDSTLIGCDLVGGYVNIDLAGSDGKTAALVAIDYGWYDILQLLLNYNAKVDTPADGSRAGRTAMQVAAERGHIAIAQLLLQDCKDISAIINAKPAIKSGRTALQAAAQGGHIDMIQFLISNGAKINDPPAAISGVTALQAAARGGHVRAAFLLLEGGANVDESAFGSATALQYAARNGHVDMVKLLLLKKLDPNRGSQGSSPLLAAVDGGHFAVVKVLMEHGVDVNYTAGGSFDRTVLQAAARYGDLQSVELFIANKAEINAEPASYAGRTALQAAAEGGYLEVAEFLLKSGADVNGNPAKSHGRTALQAAAENGHLQLVELLITRKAEINAEPASYAGRTALQAAAEGGYLEVAEFLLKSEAHVNGNPAKSYGRTALQAAAGSGHIELVKLLLSHQARINAKPGSIAGRTALQAAAESGRLDVVMLLLANKAKVNAKPADRNGESALTAASKGNHSEVINLLEAHGAISIPEPSGIKLAIMIAKLIWSITRFIVEFSFDLGWRIALLLGPFMFYCRMAEDTPFDNRDCPGYYRRHYPHGDEI